MEKLQNPYMHIELSEYTESEHDYQEDDDENNEVQYIRRKKLVMSAKSKKYYALKNIEDNIKDLFEKKRIADINPVFSHMFYEINKMTDFIEQEGMPKSFLRTLVFLRTNILKTEEDLELLCNDKKEKSELKNLSKKLKQIYKQYKTIIEENQKNNTINDVQISENEDVIIDEDKYEDRWIQEIDFKSRLTLSKEERRKFWLKKVVDDSKGKKKQKDKDRIDKSNKPILEKKFIEELEQFNNFDLKYLKTKLFKINEEKNSFNKEDLEYNLRFLNSLLDRLDRKNLDDENVKRYEEILLLIINLRNKVIELKGIISMKLFNESFNSLKDFKDLLNERPTVLPLNYEKGEKSNFNKNTLLRTFHNFVLFLDSEIFYALKLQNPFSKKFVLLLNENIELFLYFYDDLKEFYNKNVEEEKLKKKFLVEITLKQLENIYHISNDFVLNCEQLSNYFEDESISEKTETLENYILSNTQDEVKILKAKLYKSFNLIINLENLDEALKILSEIKSSKRVTSDHFLIALYNRALCQLSVSFFEKGEFEKTKKFLSDLSSKFLEDILYQYDPKEEKIYQKEAPLDTWAYFKHLNLEKIELFFLISCVLSETHKTVNFQNSLEKCGINFNFKIFLENYQKNVFVNSQNNVKDCIFMAYRKIVQCDFQTAYNCLEKISFFENIEEDVKKMYLEKVKIASMNCYFEKLKMEKEVSFNIEDISNLFQLEKNNILKLIKSKISKNEFNGKIDEKSGIIQINNKKNNEFLKNEADFSLLVKLIQLNNFNQLVKKKKSTKTRNKMIQNNFDFSKNRFNFVYDFAQLKKQFS